MNNDNTDYVSNESGTLSRLFKLPQHGTTGDAANLLI
ncbi:xanthine permease [Shigella sonnei]|nr:xanthine permease [Campylobacter jejuni]EEG4081625.1 xanthine permease [Salmonella enterica]EFY4742346.1 xanthine permease [Shigella sonnei]MBX8675361.1 xanthine permease [Shigella sonnei]MBX8679964.1 xanthine permease [Shigella sonnei]